MSVGRQERRAPEGARGAVASDRSGVRQRPLRRSPSLRVERGLLREGHLLLASMDEVGRGALAGPATVGVVLIDASIRTAPLGVRDSKLLTPAARERLVPQIRRWALASAVGHAGPDEVDQVGILGALRRAARRALATLPSVPDLVLLDGSHDWLTEPVRDGSDGALFALDDAVPAPPVTVPGWGPVPEVVVPPVRTLVKADMTCSSVAAASVLAKVERDALMVALDGEFPRYGWAENKGYSAPEHVHALQAWGPCAHHRRSWRLPTHLGPDEQVREDGAMGTFRQVSWTEAMTR